MTGTKIAAGILFFCSCTLWDACHGFHWELVSSDENSTVFNEHVFGERENTLFCEVYDNPERTGLVTHTGTLHPSEDECSYVHIEEGARPVVIRRSSKYFEVLARDAGEVIEWVYAIRDDERPDNAVPCNDAEHESCFLGRSFYSDGLCEDGLGIIDPQKHLVYFMHDDPDSDDGAKKAFRCPFFEYLTVHM